MIALGACDVFNDGPTTLALNNVKTLISMSQAEYQLRHQQIPLREQTSIDYLRARIIQDAKFSFAIEKIIRTSDGQRIITVSISEKRVAGPGHERARFRTKIKRGTDGNWKIESFQLVE